MTISKKLVMDASGRPTDVIIPYDEFVELMETYCFDLSEEEEKDLEEAIADSKAGNEEAFVSIDEL
ncbi:MAG: PHD/YefM family antitoxin component YafN of YafNO toxin-antitoxin module [Verrucomicrobiales bacterium]|jgi:PHD/YefM family antitoxin component YafN of YafNO toxin-antitoxin module